MNTRKNFIYFYILLVSLFLVSLIFLLFESINKEINQEKTYAQSNSNSHYLAALYINESLGTTGTKSVSIDGFGTYESNAGKTTSSYGTIATKITYTSGEDRYTISNSATQQASVGLLFSPSKISQNFFITSGLFGPYTTNYSVTYTATPATGFKVYFASGMRLLNGSATSSTGRVESAIGGESILLSGASTAWSTSSQSFSFDYSLSLAYSGNTPKEYSCFFIFAPCSYDITYKVDGSTWATNYSDYLNYYRLPSSPSKTGYKFLGWYNSSGQQVTSSTIKTTTGNETLTAKWEKLTYRVNVNMVNPYGEEDYNIGTFSQTYNSSTKDNLNDQYFSTMYINEVMTITNIKPKTGYKLVDCTTDNGTIKSNSGGSYTFTANFSKNPLGSSSWDATIKIIFAYDEDYEIKIDSGGGTYKDDESPIFSTTYKQLISLETPYKEGYIFDGWQNISNANILQNQFFVQEQVFDGIDDYLTIGREYMYSDKLTIAFNAYMDDWSLYGENKMRMFSCTETGGWNFESSNGNIVFAVYDKGSGYKNCTTSKAWSSLSSGWHSFVATFDGVKACLFVDNVYLGKSANFTSGLIGYNATNSIFVGAEASSSATIPDTNNPYYFKGKLQNLIIINDYVKTTNLSTNADYYLLIDTVDPILPIEIQAQWLETWNAPNNVVAIAIGEGNEESPYEISMPEQLAYLSKEVYNGNNFEGVFFKLSENIDLTGLYWQPIGIIYDATNTLKNYSFAGTFDGNGFIINGLSTSDGETYSHNYQGLFGCISDNATIKNIILTNSNIKGEFYVGGIVGLAQDNSIIEKCYNYGQVSGNSFVGGIAGFTDGNSVLIKNINYSTVNGNSYVGGIAGQTDSSITDCGVESSIYGTSNLGAIVGNVLSNGVVSNSYAISKMSENKIYGLNQGLIENIVSIIEVEDTVNKNYIGNDFSNFVWINQSYCPIPKSLLVGDEFESNVDVNSLIQKGFVEYVL